TRHRNKDIGPSLQLSPMLRQQGASATRIQVDDSLGNIICRHNTLVPHLRGLIAATVECHPQSAFGEPASLCRIRFLDLGFATQSASTALICSPYRCLLWSLLAGLRIPSRVADEMTAMPCRERAMQGFDFADFLSYFGNGFLWKGLVVTLWLTAIPMV